MANLNFKWGLHKDLGSATKSEGTVYITTDEKSMYVDVSDDKRIKIQGAVAYYDDVKEFTDTTNPPYDTETLYFFRQMGPEGAKVVVNALMAYDGTKWVQVNTPESTYKSLLDTVNQIQKTVTNFTDVSGKVTTLEGLVGVKEGEGQEATGLFKEINDLKSAIGDSGSDLGGRVEVLEGTVESLKEVPGQITGLGETLATKADAETVNEALRGKVNWSELENYMTQDDADAYQEQVNEALGAKANASDLTALVAEVEKKANANEVNQILDTKADLSKLDDYVLKSSFEDFANDVATKAELTSAVTDINAEIVKKANQDFVVSEITGVQNQINNQIKAVNALTYKDVLSKNDDFPTADEDIKIGDLYVVSSTSVTYKDENGDDVTTAPGDFFIATGTEGENGYITAGTLKWHHVKTGYDTTLEPKLVLDSSSPTVELQNYAGTSLGSITFISDNDNISITRGLDDYNHPIIKISNTWGTFGSTT